MGATRYVWVLGLPFVLCVMVPSMIGGVLTRSYPLSQNIYLPIIGFMIVGAFPITIGLSWYLTRPNKKDPITK